ncbi:polyamine ABC transporter substrate-binding protein [Pseudohoeflea coraliihabitans]|uniref:Putrescine-binding periplasmic protein n=1 Tax=Pseudohoeflea coraliihabitans TaxID=2860393 RepID=A0ABS6WN02_9HYPH|nr:polyamine ABC transporter substrate-binding protein [Pseudohoeflea sp. DP4N28-3]MBW3097326.1 polyamine ABC transporter substrate-binding protein [Pseudohoeflea sp. DP4N28-3]
MHLKSQLIAAAAMLAASTVLVQAQDRVVNIYNWSDYIDEEILTDFTEETGIEVVYDVFDSNEVLETKLLAGGTGYDIVVPTGTFLANQIKAGVFQKLDKSKLPNLSNMDPAISKRLEKYDPGNEYAVNYMWGTTGLGINVDMVKERLGEDAALDSWDLLFDADTAAKLQDCGIHMLDAPTETFPAAKNYLGMDPDLKDQESLEKAQELLLEVRPNIRKFHSSEYINALANGDICMAMGWSGDVLQARDRAAEADAGVNVEYIIPKEGALMWFDNMAIPTDAEHVEEAHEFLNYMMRPEVMAKASNYVYYANGNKASMEFLDEEVSGDPAIYPTDEAMSRLYTVSPETAREKRSLNRLWTEVKTGQ